MILSDLIRFYHLKTDEIFMVHMREETYMKIAEKGSKYYDLCKHLAYYGWRPGEEEELNEIKSKYKRVESFNEFSGLADRI